jgi:hypothetical protein
VVSVVHEVIVDTESGEAILTVDVSSYGDPGSFQRSHPDNWYPPEPIEYEIVGIELQGVELTEFDAHKLAHFDSEIVEQISYDQNFIGAEYDADYSDIM